MSRLIVLSNRVKLPDNSPMAGGLAVALNDMLTSHSGIWMGWNGQTSDSKSDRICPTTPNDFQTIKQNPYSDQTNATDNAEITYITTSLTKKQYAQFYCGFSNNVLWSLMHEQPDLVSQSADDYAGYQSVNLMFAKQLKKVLQPNDVLWVHDYHFMSVAYHCRQLGIRNRIGFFLHIPFAPLLYWQKLEQSAQLIQHMAHYDVLGVQTQLDKSNCLEVVQSYLGDIISTNALKASTSILNHSYLNNSYLDDLITNRSSLDHVDHKTLKHNTSDSIAPVNIAPVNIAQEKSDTTSLNYTPSSINSHDSSGFKTDLEICLPFRQAHILHIDSYPIGVNVTRINQQISSLNAQYTFESHSAKQTHNEHTQKTKNQQIIAVDRIDYSKGLLERFSQYDLFLNQHPTYKDDLNFLQIACPSRLDIPVYERLYEKVKRSVKALNEEYIVSECHDGYGFDKNSVCDVPIHNFDIDSFFSQNPDGANTTARRWQPITYSECVLDHDTLMQAFWHSDVGWVNSLKDGMNLVAKEYIAAQNPDNPGVLLLSCYAGASEQMQEAVIVDPKQPASVVNGLEIALTMPLHERLRRYNALIDGLQKSHIGIWQQNFLNDLFKHDKPVENTITK